MPQHDMKRAAASNSDIITPASGYSAFFFNSSGLPNYRTNDGVDHSLGMSGWYDVTAYGLVGDNNTDNLAAWGTLFALLPTGATMYFPPGTYKVSGELSINADKRIHFVGAGSHRSIITTSSTTANIFNVSIPAWYNTFEDLGFTSSVTKTAGAAITTSSGSAVGTDVRRCDFNNMFYGIYFPGAQAGNLTVIDSVTMTAPAANGRGIKIDGSSINLVISNSTINFNPGTSAISGSACIEINQCGAIQILGCDIIGGVNSLLINASSGGSTSIAAVFVSNTFFDQSGASTVKITGANVANRIKFVQCGITTGNVSSGGNAVEIASTGTGAAGTATAAADGIDFVDCDFYPNSTTGTSNGILVTGCQSFTVQSSRISGFTNGLNITPVAVAGYSRFTITENRIGPTNNFTTGNGTGILINAGGNSYASYIICDNDIAGNTTSLTDNGNVTGQKLISSNLGMPTGKAALLIADTFLTTAASRVYASLSVPPNSVTAGLSIRAKVYCSSSVATNTLAAKLVWGTTGTTSDTLIVANSALTTVTPIAAVGIYFDLELNFRTTTTAIGNMIGIVSTSAVASGQQVSTSAVQTLTNTSSQNFLTLQLTQGGVAGTITVNQAYLEVVGN